MTEYIPTVAQVRDAYGWSGHDNVFEESRAAKRAEFDRWLAARDAEQREAGRLAALEEAAPWIVDVLDLHYLVDDKNLGYYRTEVTCSCGESWWYGEHEGDPHRQEMWDKHRIAALRSSSPEGSN